MINDKVVEIKKKADEIKSLYENYLKFKEQKFSYTNLETKDGTALFIDDSTELGIGVPCYKMDDNGAPMPCEDGSYELTDGRTIGVVDGVIAEIADAMEEGIESPEETAAPEAEQMENEMPPNAEDVEDAGAGMEERMVSLEKSVEKMMEMLQGLMSKYEEDLSKVNQKMNKLVITTGDELSRKGAEKESIKSKIANQDFMAELKSYSQMRDFNKKPIQKTKEIFSEGTFSKRTEMDDMKKLMADARANGGLGSIIASAGK